jgi:two-component system NarL family sensor kinase
VEEKMVINGEPRSAKLSLTGNSRIRGEAGKWSRSPKPGPAEDLTGLAGRLLGIQDEERRRMARELHDTTLQNLAAAHMLVERLRSKRRMPGRTPEDTIEQLQGLITRSVEELKQFSSRLSPPLLKELGLVSALKPWIGEFEKRTGIAVVLAAGHYDVAGKDPNVDEALFHIIQEALINVHRHSGSATAEVRLVRDLNRTVVEVVDRGRGMPSRPLSRDVTDIPSAGVGFGSMRARLCPLGGELQISSTALGTKIRALIPSGRRFDRAQSVWHWSSIEKHRIPA